MNTPSTKYLDSIAGFISLLTQLLESQILHQTPTPQTIPRLVSLRLEITASNDYVERDLEQIMSHFQSEAHIRSLCEVLWNQTRHPVTDGLIAWGIAYGTTLEHVNLKKIATVLACMRM
jgi:hypothetical protein